MHWLGCIEGDNISLVGVLVRKEVLFKHLQVIVVSNPGMVVLLLLLLLVAHGGFL